MNRDRTLVSAVVLGLGVVLAGWFIGHGFLRGRAADRFVTVKGISEREVIADLALWPLRFVATGNDLGRAQAEIGRSTDQVYAFLARQGIDSSQVEIQGLEVIDVQANPYGEGATVGRDRYIINQTMMVRSNDPQTVLAASQRVGELVNAGVVLQSGMGFGPSRPTFTFNRLNELKPEMIAEATAAAREAAEQFALDSRSELGGIRRANQGVFVILARDQAPGIDEAGQLNKTVRVVSTIEYYLKD